MRDVWTDTFRLSDDDDNNFQPAISIIGFWWGAWIVRNIFGQISFRASMDANTIEELVSANNTIMWSLCFDMIALILIVTIIKKLQEPERRLFEKYHERDVSEHLIVQE